MTWQEIQEKYPHCWVVVEAIGAFTEGSQRVINHLEFMGMFGDNWRDAWEHYKLLHSQDIWHEYYVLHTDRPALNIGVLDAFWRVVT